jgi:hypothetical protein
MEGSRIFAQFDFIEKKVPLISMKFSRLQNTPVMLLFLQTLMSSRTGFDSYILRNRPSSPISRFVCENGLKTSLPNIYRVKLKCIIICKP